MGCDMAAKAKRQQRIDQPQRGRGRIRGVTRAQYLILRRMVNRGEATWADLERKGIVLPTGRESDYRQQVRRALSK